MRLSRTLATLGMIGMIVPFLLGGAAIQAEEQSPSGTVSLQTTSVAAGIGVQWGDGTLTFNGLTYPFSVQGLELLGIGAAQVTAEGTVYNLTRLSDFEGVYAAAEAGIAAGSGPATITMKNPNGVVLRIHAIQEGVKLTLAAQGVEIKLKEAL
jgi:outer membrane immunogenic protein